MNRIILGVFAAFHSVRPTQAWWSLGSIQKSLAMLLQGFSSRWCPWFVDKLLDAFSTKSYLGILGTGLIFVALAGWAAKTWAT